MRVGGLRLPQITATFRLPRRNPQSKSPVDDNTDLRRLYARPFRQVRTAPRHARRDSGVYRRIRPAADASGRGGRPCVDAEGAVRFGLAPRLDHDADAV